MSRAWCWSATPPFGTPRKSSGPPSGSSPSRAPLRRWPPCSRAAMCRRSTSASASSSVVAIPLRSTSARRKPGLRQSTAGDSRIFGPGKSWIVIGSSGSRHPVDPELELSRDACRERPHVAIPRHTERFHLSGDSGARPFSDAPRAGVLRMNGRDRVRQPQNVARVVANALRCFGRETLAPDGGVERVAELTLEGQLDVGGRPCEPEPSSANTVLGFRGFDNHLHQAAASDPRSVRLAHDTEIAERGLLIACERGLQPCFRLRGGARPAFAP